MQKYLDKLINKIRELTNSSEADAQKILVGLTILGIAISWFAMGKFLAKDRFKPTPQEQKEMQELQELMATEQNK